MWPYVTTIGAAALLRRARARMPFLLHREGDDDGDDVGGLFDIVFWSCWVESAYVIRRENKGRSWKLLLVVRISLTNLAVFFLYLFIYLF